MYSLHSIDVTDLKEITNGYRFKTSILDLGIYIHGWTARVSDRNSSGWWIQPPAVYVNNKWVSQVEFDKSKPLWLEIERTTLEALQNYDL